jgi:hypothetical protein
MFFPSRQMGCGASTRAVRDFHEWEWRQKALLLITPLTRSYSMANHLSLPAEVFYCIRTPPVWFGAGRSVAESRVAMWSKYNLKISHFSNNSYNEPVWANSISFGGSHAWQPWLTLTELDNARFERVSLKIAARAAAAAAAAAARTTESAKCAQSDFLHCGRL